MPPRKGRKGEAGSRPRRPSAAFAAIKSLSQNKNGRSIAPARRAGALVLILRTFNGNEVKKYKQSP